MKIILARISKFFALLIVFKIPTKLFDAPTKLFSHMYPAKF